MGAQKSGAWNDVIALDTVVSGDCVDVLRTIPDAVFDLVILDPPYWKVANHRWDFEWRTEGEWAEWCTSWLTEVARVSRRSASLYLFGYLRNLLHIVDIVGELGFLLRQPITIDKGLRSIAGRATREYKMFPNTTETCLFFVKDSRPFIRDVLKGRQRALGLSAKQINEALGCSSTGGGMWSLWTGDNIDGQVPTRQMWRRLQDLLDFELPHEEIAQTWNVQLGLTDVWSDIDFYREKRYHPTQKPVPLMERLILASTDPGMTVLDPFFGSGATGIAASRLGRHYIGIEREESYVNAARNRIAHDGSRTTHPTGGILEDRLAHLAD